MDSKTLTGDNLFDTKKIQNQISSDSYQAYMNCPLGEPLPEAAATEIANAIKSWARERNVMNYCYWYFPLLGKVAFKRESFFSQSENFEFMNSFSAEQLTISHFQEAFNNHSDTKDRDYFEARGYTMWDHTSPPFIIEKTLYIPTIFLSYGGKEMDYKSVLIKSISAIEKGTKKVSSYFDREVESVSPFLGWEQEFYIFDKSRYAQYEDLRILNKRIIDSNITNPSEDSIDLAFFHPRIDRFFEELSQESMKLGFVIKTIHKEVGPNQFECASSAERLNNSIDHNLIFMQLAQVIATKHHLKILFKEKPFRELSGSSKHLNISLVSNKGDNYLAPGKTSRSNIRFLTFFIICLQAIKESYEIIYSSCLTYDNEFRLGLAEAPPKSISVYTGDYLESILHEINQRVGTKPMSEKEKNELKFDLGKIPHMLLDNTDAARTAPIAFTGNKFELRLPGASVHPSQVLIIFNAVLAEQLDVYAAEINELSKKGIKRDEAVFKMLKKYIQKSADIIFNDNDNSKKINQFLSRQKHLPSTSLVANQFLSESAIIKIMHKQKIMEEKDILRYFHNLKIQIYHRITQDSKNLLKIIEPILFHPHSAQPLIHQSSENDSAMQEIFLLKKEILLKYKDLEKSLSLKIDEKNIQKQINKQKDLEDILSRYKVYSNNLFEYD